MTEEFVEFSKVKGNDLSTPRPEFHFQGLKEGDHWCVCFDLWLEAYRARKACPVKLASTREETLAIIALQALKEFSFKDCSSKTI